MDYRLTDDQRLLIDGVRDFLAGECAPDAVRAAAKSGKGDESRWAALVGVGVVGATVPAEHGGMGLTELDMVGLLVEAGRACLPEPLLETAVGIGLLSDVGGQVAAEWLPRIAGEGARVAVAMPDVDPYVRHLDGADLLIIATSDQVSCTTSPQIDGASVHGTLDPTCQVVDAASVTSLATTTLATGDQAAEATARSQARAATYAAATLVGLGHAMIDQAVTYAGQREQFGAVIGSFQAVKHHLATALVDVTFARPLAEKAADTLTRRDSLDQVTAYAAAAKAFAGEAADAAARHSLQVHGAIGYTDECDLQLWMKRTWSLAASFGSTESQWQSIESHLLA